jgi:hypothetical protein
LGLRGKRGKQGKQGKRALDSDLGTGNGVLVEIELKESLGVEAEFGAQDGM